MLFELSDDFVSLQLILVDRFVELGMGSRAEGVHQLTNLQRRVGLGTPTDPPSSPAWIDLLERLGAAATHDERVKLVMGTVATLPPPVPEHIIHGWPTVGAFSVQVSGRIARTHFFSTDTDDRSPLHPTKLRTRRRELRSVLAAASNADAEHRIERVEGASWLYTTRSYASLFPRQHVDAAVVRRGRDSFRGMSHWGQFVDHRGRLRTNLAEVFRARVGAWTGDDPCLLFPIPTLQVSSPIEAFDADR